MELYWTYTGPILELYWMPLMYTEWMRNGCRMGAEQMQNGCLTVYSNTKHFITWITSGKLETSCPPAVARVF